MSVFHVFSVKVAVQGVLAGSAVVTNITLYLNLRLKSRSLADEDVDRIYSFGPLLLIMIAIGCLVATVYAFGIQSLMYSLMPVSLTGVIIPGALIGESDTICRVNKLCKNVFYSIKEEAIATPDQADTVNSWIFSPPLLFIISSSRK